jgi:hypothetical protein
MIRLSFGMLLLGCLMAPALPAQETPAQPNNQVTIHVADGDLIARAGLVTVFFNPKEIPVDQAVPWQPHRNSEGDRPELEFTSADGRCLSFELFFDGYEGSPSPREFGDILKNLVGQNVQIPVTWGGKLWTAPLLRADVRFSNLDALGNPGRAIVTTYWGFFKLADSSRELPFTVDIPGCPEAATDIREISIDPLTLESPPPGGPRRARFTLALRHGIPAELQLWHDEWVPGLGLRKNITVTIFNISRTPIRSYTLDAGGPIGLTVRHPHSPIPYLDLEVSYDRVVFNPLPGEAPPAAAPAAPALPAQVLQPSPFIGFEVTLTSDQGVGATAFFKSVGGLSVETEVVDFQEGGITGFTKRLIGKVRWPNLTLVGPLQDIPPVFLGWANGAFNGQGLPLEVTLTPMYLFNGQPRPTRSLVTEATLPDRYVFPRLSAIRSDGDVTEKCSLPPVHAVLQGK